jgi:hypothetical protein
MATNYDPVVSPDKPVTTSGVLTFPYPTEAERLNRYDYYENLFCGNHFDAFSIKIRSDEWTKEYARLRYIVANFAGLVSKIVADMLFIDPPKVVLPEGSDQDWLDGLMKQNKMRIVNYESALANSYLGDSVYKLRIGKRMPNDTEASIIIEEITPKLYFPIINQANVKAEPEKIELNWTVKINNKEYLRKEIHSAGAIDNELWLLNGSQIAAREPLTTLGIPDLAEHQDTGIDELLVVHVPNWRAGNRHYGISDYYDLTTLFYAMNNRMSMIDNILDKHSDPILAIPDGILDENGRVKKEKLGLFERPLDADKENDPAYITWDANLESAFMEVDKLVEMTFMMSETAPDILGMGKGQSDSGRALKLKLIRTLAKTQRKQLYYTEGLKEVMYRAQLLAKKYGIKIEGKTLQSDPAYPEIVWKDGLPADIVETVQVETQRIDAGLTTKADAIARIEDIDEKTAEEKAKAIEKETQLAMPEMKLSPDGKPVPQVQPNKGNGIVS